MPTADGRLPYGVEATGATAESIGTALRRPHTAEVGERDVAPDDTHLPITRRALGPGSHWFERAHGCLAADRVQAG